MKLNALSDGWGEDLVREAEHAHSKFVLPIATMLVSGARSVEFASGIEVSVLPGEQEVQIVIKGAKYRPGWSGQQQRTLRCALDSPGVSWLFAAAKENGGQIVVRANPGSLRDAIRRFGQRVYDAGDYAISSYSLRHQFASDMKADETTRDEAPAALGHATDRTMQGYGDRRYARGQRRLTATASGPVKRTASDPRAWAVAKKAPSPALKPRRRRPA